MVDRNLKTEYDKYGNRIHYVTKDNIHFLYQPNSYWTYYRVYDPLICIY